MTATAMTMTATAATTGTTRFTLVRKYMTESAKPPPDEESESPGISRAGARVPERAV